MKVGIVFGELMSEADYEDIYKCAVECYNDYQNDLKENSLDNEQTGYIQKYAIDWYKSQFENN